MRDSLRLWLLLSAVWLVGCPPGGNIPDATTSTSSSSSGGGTGGGPANPCGVDCSGFKTGECEVAVCNTGQVAGSPLNTCIVIPAQDGSLCDDGLFCTVSDFCDKGTCVGGAQNGCGIAQDPCSSTICYEDTKTCSVSPAGDGTACTPTDLCHVDGVCTVGECVGVPKDCSGSPLTECNTVACDPGTGQCKGAPDTNKNGNPCVFSGDLCTVGKACLTGQCVGGSPKDCSLLDVQCQIGVCDTSSGVCAPANAPVGTVCTNGLQACQTGQCNVKAACVPSTAHDGTSCNDRNACTEADTCLAGVCAGTSVKGCSVYFDAGFETCPDGWILAGDWQCGTPTNMSPVTPFDGHGVLATQLDGLYHNNDTFSTSTATSTLIDLTAAINPQVSFWAWVWTDAYDGGNLSVSTDGGVSFQQLTTVTPVYPQSVLGELVWGGNLSGVGWQPYLADLTAYAGHTILLRFAFASNNIGVYPGIYVDDLLVAEPLETPLYITTPPGLPDAYVGQDYSGPMSKIGGTIDSVWSIVPGGVNTSWLKIDPATGELSGTPMTANIGPVTVTVLVQEPALPSNYAEMTFTFTVNPDTYYTSWEGVCPNGWTLTGDWKCGIPTNSTGPATAYAGTQCLGTGLSTSYSNNDTWATTTATSPSIDLAGMTSPSLTFRMWVHTESFDGANLEISSDGGATYSPLNSVTPAYGLMIGGEPAWGGDQSALGWQLVQADLSAYSGMKVLFRFGFQSDASTTFAGVYVDDFLVE